MFFIKNAGGWILPSGHLVTGLPNVPQHQCDTIISFLTTLYYFITGRYQIDHIVALTVRIVGQLFGHFILVIKWREFLQIV